MEKEELTRLARGMVNRLIAESMTELETDIKALLVNEMTMADFFERNPPGRVLGDTKYLDTLPDRLHLYRGTRKEEYHNFLYGGGKLGACWSTHLVYSEYYAFRYRPDDSLVLQMDVPKSFVIAVQTRPHMKYNEIDLQSLSLDELPPDANLEVAETFPEALHRWKMNPQAYEDLRAIFKWWGDA